MTPIRKRMLEAGEILGMSAEEMDERVREWLRFGEDAQWLSCPFDCGCRICDAMFPKRDIKRCPYANNGPFPTSANGQGRHWRSDDYFSKTNPSG